MKLAEIEKKLEIAERRLMFLRAAEAEALGRKLVTCTSSVRGKGCGRKSQIGTLTYIQTHWYKPHTAALKGATGQTMKASSIALSAAIETDSTTDPRLMS